MRSRGFSLVEMVLIMAMVAILMTIGTFAFQDYSRRYRTEAQTRLLFSEVLKARANAICQRRGTRVKFFADRFEVYSSQQDGSTVRPLETHRLTYPLTSNGTGWGEGMDVDFDESGIASKLCSICLDPSAGSGAVDSVVIYWSRISIGKKDKGNGCEDGSITYK